jgi:hypothetical protein
MSAGASADSLKSSAASQERAEALRRYGVWAAVAVAVVFCVAVRSRLLSVPLERDEGEYAYAGQLILKGFPPYLHAYNMKFPGTYAAYAAVMALFGQSAAGVHFGLLLINVATTGLIFLLAKRLTNRFTATISAVSFAILSLSQWIPGIYAHAENFVIFFAVGGLLMLLIGIDGDRKLSLFAAGALLGLAVLMKQPGFMFFVFACFYLAWTEWRSKPFSMVRAGRRFGALVLGLVAPLALVGLWLVQSHVFGRFWFWTIEYGRQYATEVPISAIPMLFGLALQRMAAHSLALLLLAVVGAVVLRRTEAANKSRVFIAGLFACSFLAVCPGWYFRPHYFLMLIPSAALFIGIAISFGDQILVNRRLKPAYRAIPAGLLILALGTSLLSQRRLLFEADPGEVSRYIYDMNPYPESVVIAKYIKSQTGPEDRIAVLGSEPEIYFYADRLSATGYIYTYALMEHRQAFASQMEHELVNEVETAAPEFVVYVPIATSWGRDHQSSTEVFDWISQYVGNNYDLIGTAEIGPEFTLYNWDQGSLAHRQWKDAAGIFWPSVPTMFVYRKKAH